MAALVAAFPNEEEDAGLIVNRKHLK